MPALLGPNSWAIQSANFSKSYKSRLGITVNEIFGRLKVTTKDFAVFEIFNIFITSVRTAIVAVAVNAVMGTFG